MSYFSVNDFVEVLHESLKEEVNDGTGGVEPSWGAEPCDCLRVQVTYLVCQR